MLDVRAETVWAWSKQYPEFSNAIKKIEEKQKNQLMNDGMYGGKEVNPGMAIFLLKANHKLSDGSNIQVNQQFNVGDKMSLEFIGGDNASPVEPVATDGSK